MLADDRLDAVARRDIVPEAFNPHIVDLFPALQGAHLTGLCVTHVNEQLGVAFVS